ncbi:isatin hydrolase-like [Homarus americanus]|uniref:Isatin hydrolase-like 3 n=1 Tax=Homarus americanus TaxID=6706 RepID=A0A8J5TCD5_HOMAM|nr:isatin hydrolase-like [Homarus americanus]KAG7173941.1 Isatin hydrolase-like 3 [Homarus americanus]
MMRLYYSLTSPRVVSLIITTLTCLLLVMLALPVSTELLELSYTYNIDAPTSPKLKPFTSTILNKSLNELGFWVELNEFCTSEHSGTHVDAPVHFSKDSWTLDAIPLDRLWRVPGVVIDVSEAIRVSGERNYGIKAKDLEAWEEDHGTIPDGVVVLIRTGWGKKSQNLGQYSGLDLKKRNNFPGLSEEAATWLATHGSRHGHSRGVMGVGVDTISVDVGNSTHYLAHRAMYSRNVYGMENLANLDKLPPSGFLLTILPMKIGGGSGGPARIIAEVPVGVPSSIVDTAGSSCLSSCLSLPFVLLLARMMMSGLQRL